MMISGPQELIRKKQAFAGICQPEIKRGEYCRLKPSMGTGKVSSHWYVTELPGRVGFV